MSEASLACKSGQAPLRCGLCDTGENAFTLVELLTALVIAALAAGAVYSLLYSGLRLWRSTTDDCRLVFEEGLLRDAFERDLRGALDAVIEDAPAFVADGTSMEFLTTGSGTSAAGNWPLRRVRYVFEKTEGSATGAVIVESTPHAGSLPLTDRPAKDTLLGNVRSFALRYYRNNRWEELWQYEGLPAAVELNAVVAGVDGRAERSLSVVIDLPCSVGRGQ